MPEEVNEETTADELDDRALQEGPVTDAEIRAQLGLNENLEPISEQPERRDKAKDRGNRAGNLDKDHGAEVKSVSGENADEEGSPDEEAAEEASDSGEEKEGEEEAPEEEAPEEQEEEEEEQPAAKQGLREKMQRRIDKLTAIRKDLEAKLERAQPVTLNPTYEDPLSHLMSEREVEDFLASQREVRRWCIENFDGGEMPDGKGEMHELSAKQVRARLARLDEVIQLHVPARKAYLKALTGCDDLGRRAYPALYDSSSQESKIANDFLQRCPQILRLPNYQLIIGDAIRGMQARLAEEQSGGAGSKVASPGGVNGKATAAPGRPAPKLAPRAIKPGATARQQSTKGSAATSRLEREFLGSGDKDTLTAFIASTL
jgi:hypothetical protein